MAYITAEQLTELLQVLLLLSLLCGVSAVLLAQLFHGMARTVARWFEKRGKPPSPALMRAVAKNMRKRAAQLEIKAEQLSQ